MTGGLKESRQSSIEIKEIQERSFWTVLRHIYTKSLDVNGIEDILVDVFIAASRFDVLELKAHLEAVIQHNLSVENVASLLILSVQEDARKLKRSCVRFIQNHREEIKKDDDFEAIQHLLPDAMNVDEASL